MGARSRWRRRKRREQDRKFRVYNEEIDGRTKVQFSDVVTIIYLPYEDRTFPWIIMALDRCRFQRRIEESSRVLEPMLQIMLMKISHSNIV